MENNIYFDKLRGYIYKMVIVFHKGVKNA